MNLKDLLSNGLKNNRIDWKSVCKITSALLLSNLFFFLLFNDSDKQQSSRISTQDIRIKAHLQVGFQTGLKVTLYDKANEGIFQNITLIEQLNEYSQEQGSYLVRVPIELLPSILEKERIFEIMPNIFQMTKKKKETYEDISSYKSMPN